MTDSAPAVRVVIVNFNGGADLLRCTAALQGQTFTDFEVVVVDNASTDGSINALADIEARDSRFSVRKLDRNIGFAAGNNLAAEGANAAWIATLNPDAFADPDWLECLMAATDRFPGADMFGSTQIDAADAGRLDGTGDALFFLGIPWRGNFGRPVADQPPDGQCFSPCGAAALYRTDRFRVLGGFDERFFCYCEDVDIGFRFRLTGGECIQVADARVSHVGSASAGRHSEFTTWHSSRNRIWLMVKNLPGILFWVLLPGIVLTQLALLVWATFRGRGGATCRGIAAALGGLRPCLRDRRAVQATRTVPMMAIARALCWAPFRMLRRAHDVRK